ncbi:MAG: tripartite tricarboxylate transporter substrate binding protein [Acetobacteraceae bacterium]|nr:tripartite tricarboxylate transporter substrate binding protein [Acetobacteraceae bacterium]
MLLRVVLTLVLLLGGLPAAAAEFTANRAVRIIVPVSPGGTADVTARIMAQALTPMWGQQVVVESRTGAGGHIAGEMVARSPGDGHTILFGTIAIHAATAMYHRLTYDPAKDLAGAVLLVEVPFVVITHPAVPFRTLPELVAAARARPGQVTFGSAGNVTSTHMAGELFQLVTGAQLQHVPYRGSSQAMNDLIAGTINMMFENLPTVPPAAADGRVRALAITAAARVPQLPEVPTTAEAGQPDFVANAFFTLAVPASTPAPLLAALNADLRAALFQPAVHGRLVELGSTPRGLTVPEIRAYFAAETERWTRVIRTANLRAD